MNAISKLFDVSVPAVLKWIRAFAKKQAPKTTLSPGTPIVLELNEMWHYVKHKSIIVSKSVEMVDLTIALFARFRVNGNIFDILKISEK